MKRRLYPLLLLAVFLLGCLGHLLLKPKKEALFPYFVTFTSENVNNLLLYSLPNVGDALSFSGVSGEVLEIYHTPTTLHLRSEGETHARTSRLFSNVTLRLRIAAGEVGGRLTVGGAPLFLGDTVTLSGSRFTLSARFTGFRADFS